jgi:spore maturation protein CgeB
MKILFVDLQYDYGIPQRGPNYIGEEGFRQSMLKLQHSVETFYYDDYLRPPRMDALQHDLIMRANAVNPDLIFFILFENQFSVDTLSYLKSRFTTVNWFCDDQWRFDDFTRIYAPLFTYCITTDKYSLRKYQEVGQRNVIVSQWAAMDSQQQPQFAGYEYDVAFVGGIHPYRAWFIDQMGKKGINVEAFGHGWPNGSVTLEGMNRIFRSSKINLNISNSLSYDMRYVLSSVRNMRNHFRTKKNFSQVKARNFEIPFFGGFQLAEYVPGLDDYFDLGKEVICYKDVDEAVMLIRYYLDNDVDREHIRRRGHEKALQIHGYIHRLENVLKEIQKC